MAFARVKKLTAPIVLWRAVILCVRDGPHVTAIHGFAPSGFKRLRRTSFQSPPSIKGRSRTNGT